MIPSTDLFGQWFPIPAMHAGQARHGRLISPVTLFPVSHSLSGAFSTAPTNSCPSVPSNPIYPLANSRSVEQIPARVTRIRASPGAVSGIGRLASDIRLPAAVRTNARIPRQRQGMVISSAVRIMIGVALLGLSEPGLRVWTENSTMPVKIEVTTSPLYDSRETFTAAILL